MVRTWTTRLVLGLIAPAFALGCGHNRQCCCPCQCGHPAAEAVPATSPAVPVAPAKPTPQTPAAPMSATRTASATMASDIPQLVPAARPIRME
jgi:hypothetical protein